MKADMGGVHMLQRRATANIQRRGRKWNICLKNKNKFSVARTMCGEDRMVGNKPGQVDRAQKILVRDVCLT